MKQVIAVVRPYLAEQILEGLKRAPIESLSVREVRGYGRQKSYLEEYTKNEYATAFLPKVEISIWVEDMRVDEIVQRVVDVARTGRMGDGKVFVMPGDSYERVMDIAGAGDNNAATPSGKKNGRKAGSEKRSKR